MLIKMSKGNYYKMMFFYQELCVLLKYNKNYIKKNFNKSI